MHREESCQVLVDAHTAELTQSPSAHATKSLALLKVVSYRYQMEGNFPSLSKPRVEGKCQSRNQNDLTSKLEQMIIHSRH